MRHGKDKEFNSLGLLIFEGEYLKGRKWNGIGYQDNYIIYELHNGKGKIKEYEIEEYDKNFRLMYKGEFLNGERNGKGKFYDEDYGTSKRRIFKWKKMDRKSV